MTIITKTPTTCHHTEILFNIACTWLLIEFKMVIRIMIMANQKNCWLITSPDRNAFVYPGEKVLIVILRKVAAPYATEALTASRPIRFSQPVKNPAFIPPSLQAHQYIPPEVGYAE